MNDIINELGTNFIEYSVAVNTDRAIPNAKDGLKPVAKRILYGTYDKGYTTSKPHVKCANIVGNVMADFHPHGDSSIYGALVRLSQPWVMRYPLIDWHGNNGNRHGDGPAAYRYTEARLGHLAEDGMLQGINKNNVDFIPNYSETKDEPVDLPAIFPNLLCNPNTGIGVAMACNWLPHNLCEVADAINMYLDGSDPQLPGPDFPTGGLIINKSDIPDILKSGQGTIKLRGKYKFEDDNIVFYELPYGIGTEAVMEQIGKAVDDEKIINIEAIRNESNKKNGFRLVIECSKGADKEPIVNLLFKETDLQTNISYNQVALVDKVPTELGLKDAIKVYVEHNIKCIVKEANFDVDKDTKKVHIVEGLIKALDNIDDIISVIKSSDNISIAKDSLMTKFSFSEEQAQAILDMKLSRLAKLEKTELENNKKELENHLEELKKIILNPSDELRKRLADIVQHYGDARRTELDDVVEVAPEVKETIYVEPEKCVVIMTEAGTIKRIPTSTFKPQKKGGIGTKTQEEITSAVIRTNTVDSLMIFTNKGNMYRLLVNDIPEGTNISKGTAVRSLTAMDIDETPNVIYSIYRDTDAKYVLFITKNGLVKKTSLEEYINIRKKSGIAAIKLRNGDDLADVTLIKNEEVILTTNDGMAIRFDTEDINESGRMTTGVKGINLRDGDFVVSATPIRDINDDLTIFSSTGYAKRINLKDITSQSRGGRGISVLKTSSSRGNIATTQLLNDTDFVLVIGNKSSICISAADIPVTSRMATGNIVFKGGKVLEASKV